MDGKRTEGGCLYEIAPGSFPETTEKAEAGK